jgi:hypothetical protein
VQGQYITPRVDVTVSADYRYFSGQTYAAEGLASEYLIDPDGSPNDPNNLARFNQGRVRYFVDERGSKRLDATNNLNMRAEKFFSFEKGSRLGLFADIFNVFNKGEDTAVNVRYGRRFGDTVAFSSPRVTRLGVRYTW